MAPITRRTFCSQTARASLLALSGDLVGQSPALAGPMSVEVPGPSPTRSGKRRPNIIVIVADDFGWGDVGYHGGVTRTPNIDRLASEGAALERFYVFPVCSPTRAGLLTGRNPLRLGITGTFKPGDAGLSLHEHLLPQTLRASGYQTWMCGKWHLGGFTDSAYAPMNRGFDHFYGHLGGAIDYFQHVNRELNQVDWQRNGETVREDGYSTDLLTQEAIRLVENRDPDRPFFLYLPFNAAHGPHSAPESWLSQYAEMNDRKARTYGAVVSAMDAAIARLIDVINRQGIANNTLTLFFGDNGAQSSSGTGSNAPLRGEKGTVWEGGIRVPAWIHWPHVITPGRRDALFLSVMDVFPTLAAAAGVSPGNTLPLDGHDRWQEVCESASCPPERLVIGQGKDLAVLDGEWKYLEIANVGERHLFRIGQDPLEQRDLAHEHPEVLNQLATFAHEFAPVSAGRGKGGGAQRLRQSADPERAGKRVDGGRRNAERGGKQ